MGGSQSRESNSKMENNQKESKSDEHGNSSCTRPLAIGAPRTSNAATGEPLQPLSNQPNQPRNLQGLLKFAMEATKSEDAPQNSVLTPMDNKKKEFLSNALNSLCVNVIEELLKSIETLKKVPDLRIEDDVSEYDTALETITEYIDNIDIANDFYKIGGFSIFDPCLNSPHSSIRWKTAEIIAELSQNNPFCQERILEAGLFPILLNMIDTDESDTVRVKALYAISCIVRGHPQSIKYMEKHDGYSVLLRAIQSSVEKLQIKSAFLLSSLCGRNNADDIKFTLVNMGFIEQVTGMLTSTNLLPEIRDQLLSVLSGLITNFLPGSKEARKPKLGLKSTLQKFLKELNPEINEEEIRVCHHLMDLLFSDSDTVQER